MYFWGHPQTMWIVFMHFELSHPPYWTILLSKAAYVRLGKPPFPLPCPHGLWMNPT